MLADGRSKACRWPFESLDEEQENPRIDQNRYNVCPKAGTVLKEMVEPVCLEKIILKPAQLPWSYDCTNMRAAVRDIGDFFGVGL